MVTIVIPCRNEEQYLATCLDSILAGEVPHADLEILIVDGMSSDGTRDIIGRYAAKYEFIRMLDNPRRIVPTALNIGIRQARGSIIARMDAHNVYAADYLSKCLRYLDEYHADNVGGIWVTVPGGDTPTAQAIALAVNHPFAAGNARYRTGAEKPLFVDTVPFGCYRKEVFDRIGCFDEDLVRNQDDEFNLRLLRRGGKILLAPDIVSTYHARASIGKLARMYYQYGYFKPLVAIKVGAVLTARQLIPAVFVAALAASVFLSLFGGAYAVPLILLWTAYASASMVAACRLGRGKGLIIALLLPAVFLCIHMSYGAGYLRGIWDFLLFRKHRKRSFDDISVTR